MNMPLAWVVHVYAATTSVWAQSDDYYKQVKEFKSAVQEVRAVSLS